MYYLYFIRCNTYTQKYAKKRKIKHDINNKNPIKIGIAKDPQARIANLQTGCPYKLDLIEVFTFKTEMHARGAERRLHKMFQAKGKRMNGEWFRGSILKNPSIVEMIMLEHAREDKTKLSEQDLECLSKADIHGY